MRVSALRQVVTPHVLAETRGSLRLVEQEDDGEAMILVDPETARAKVASPLTKNSNEAADLLHRATDTGFGGPHRQVRRMLVETPIVHLDELTDADADWPRTRQRHEAQAFCEFPGLDARSGTPQLWGHCVLAGLRRPQATARSG
ncbi:DUF2398 family protein [Streptomyces sp. NBC_01190]|uniref:DUF2398 family protein n=1 Tax=Streptomyces sp. NBC_01190 TaxID=2903767 RepID=UPI0038655412|nr:DUF2398 family protein [Streptomyces sp. NBC_01190]